MRAERNAQATKLKVLITALEGLLDEREWKPVALVLADAIAEIDRLETKVRDLSEDRDYWQHKWGNGNG